MFQIIVLKNYLPENQISKISFRNNQHWVENPEDNGCYNELKEGFYNIFQLRTKKQLSRSLFNNILPKAKRTELEYSKENKT